MTATKTAKSKDKVGRQALDPEQIGVVKNLLSTGQKMKGGVATGDRERVS
ncbi:MAG: hypothetical protein ACRC2V_11785 [Xenococcaceae cyanobacterium]